MSPTNASETRLVWTFIFQGLNVEIYAPYQAYPNATMRIRIKIEAREELQDVTVRFRVYGSKSQGYVGWYNILYALYKVDLPLGVVEDQYFDMDISADVDPGTLYSQTSCTWKVLRESSWLDQSFDGVFRVSYLMNKPYEDLQVAYNQLLANYSTLQMKYDEILADYNSLQTSYNVLENRCSDLQANYSALLMNYNQLLAYYNTLQSNFSSLQNNYTHLQADYGSLNLTYYNLSANYSSLQASYNELRAKYEFGGEMANTLNLMYVFVETTVIFIATAIYFAREHIYSALRKLNKTNKPNLLHSDINEESRKSKIES